MHKSNFAETSFVTFRCRKMLLHKDLLTKTQDDIKLALYFSMQIRQTKLLKLSVYGSRFWLKCGQIFKFWTSNSGRLAGTLKRARSI